MYSVHYATLYTRLAIRESHTTSVDPGIVSTKATFVCNRLRPFLCCGSTPSNPYFAHTAFVSGGMRSTITGHASSHIAMDYAELQNEQNTCRSPCPGCIQIATYLHLGDNGWSTDVAQICASCKLQYSQCTSEADIAQTALPKPVQVASCRIPMVGSAANLAQIALPKFVQVAGCNIPEGGFLSQSCTGYVLKSPLCSLPEADDGNPHVKFKQIAVTISRDVYPMRFLPNALIVKFKKSS